MQDNASLISHNESTSAGVSNRLYERSILSEEAYL